MGVTKSNKNNIKSPLGNSLALFVDYNDNQLKLKDISGNVQDITDYVNGIPAGVLQLENGVPLDSTYRPVQDYVGNNSPLYMSLNGVTAIGTGGIMTNTVFGAASSLYNGTAYENTILGYNSAPNLSLNGSSLLTYTGFGNVVLGYNNMRIQNAIRNVFIGYGVANATSSSIQQISCIDNICIGYYAGRNIQSITENNIYLGSLAGNPSQSVNCIGIGYGAHAYKYDSVNNIAIGLGTLAGGSSDNSIAIGYVAGRLDGLGTGNNDIIMGNYAFYSSNQLNYFSQNNIVFTNYNWNNKPLYTENSVTIIAGAITSSIYGVQIGGKVYVQPPQIDKVVDNTCTFIGAYADINYNATATLRATRLTLIGANYSNVFQGESNVVIGASGGGFVAEGDVSYNTMIATYSFYYKDYFQYPDQGYLVSNATIINTYEFKRTVLSQTIPVTITNLTLLGNSSKRSLNNNSNNAILGSSLFFGTTSGFLSTKSNSTAVGYNALRSMTTGIGLSTAIGAGCLNSESTGTRNTAIGASSISGATSSYHTLVGQGITNSVTTTAGVTIIGQGITNSSAGTGALILGKSAANTAAARAVFGSASVNAGAIAVESLVSNTTWTVIINGTQYKMLLKA